MKEELPENYKSTKIEVKVDSDSKESTEQVEGKTASPEVKPASVETMVPPSEGNVATAAAAALASAAVKAKVC